MKIFIGNDHAGVEMALEIVSFLTSLGHEAEHVGCFNQSSVDYPSFGVLVGEKVVETAESMGIVICGTGIGISIAANKVHGIRCANCVSPFMAEMARKHNNANILALGARILDMNNAKTIVETFLDTAFEGGRHEKRVCLLNDL